MDPHFICRVTRRRDENLDPDLGPCRRKFLAADEDPIERNIAGKTAFRSLSTFEPMEDDGEAQLVSRRCSALRIHFRTC
jgi:hypothetical protein